MREYESTDDLYDIAEAAGLDIAGSDEIERCANCGGPIKPIRGQEARDGLGRPLCSILCSMFNDPDEHADLPDSAAETGVIGNDWHGDDQ